MSMSDESLNDQLTTLIAPVLGVFTSNLLALGPLSAVLACRESKRLGELNPLMFPLLFGTCIGWVIYSTATLNPYLFAGNVGGVILSFFYLLSVYSLCNCEATKSRLEIISLFLLALWCFVGFSAAMMDNKALGVHIIGLLGNIVVFLLFASPLLTFWKVISTGDSSSINRPFAYCQVLNCSTWVAYGLAISDVYIAVPNFVGVVFGLAQVVLILSYPAAPPEDQLHFAPQDTGSLYSTF